MTKNRIHISFISLALLLLVTCAAFANENVSTRAIIGNDDRISISAPQETLFSPVGLLLSIYPDGYISQCTGTLIDRDMVATAGHCLQREDGTEADTVIFAPSAGPGWSLPELPYGFSYAESLAYWPCNSDGGFYPDLGFVRLEQPLGDTAGTFPVIFADADYVFDSDGWIPGANVGYPAGSQLAYFNEIVMWGSLGYLRSWSSLIPGYYLSDIDITNGHSGGPFLCNHNGVVGVIAVCSGHISEPYAWDGFEYDTGQPVNCFTAIFENWYNSAMQAFQ